MGELIRCEHCKGTGVEPRQAMFDAEVTLCIDCDGYGSLPSEVVLEVRSA